MTVQEFISTVESVKFPHFMTRVDLTAGRFADRDEVYVGIVVKVPDRDGIPVEAGGASSITGMQTFAEAALPHLDREYLLYEIRRLVRDAMFHEVDENMIVNGKRIFDPHAHEYKISMGTFTLPPDVVPEER